MTRSKSAILAAACALVFPTASNAGPLTTPAVEVEQKSILDKIWAIPVIYSNKENPIIQEFRFVGREQVDAFLLSSNAGNEDDWVVRRTRFGIKGLLFHNLTFHGEVDFNLQDPTPAYTRLTDAYLAWSFSDAAVLTVGKQGAPFTLDGATSSKSLLTIDRSNLANNLWFPTEYFSGASLSGEMGEWQYLIGGYSRSDGAEFGDFNVGYFGIFSVGYDIGKMLGLKKALVRADYVYNDPDAESNGTRPFENIGSLVFQVENARWGFWGDFAAGQGFGSQSNVYGMNLMPWYNITEKFQAVLRYTYLHSAEPNGVRLARYDNYVTSQRGDEYNEVYAGLNYFFFGQKLKIQTGVSYVNLSNSPDPGDYNSWQWTTGLRISF